MKPIWVIALALAFAAAGFVGGMEFQRWRAGDSPEASGAAGAPGAAAGEPEGGRGDATLVVRTQRPVALRVEIDGRVKKGRSPLTLVGLRPGRHELLVGRRGFPLIRELVDLRAAERVERLVVFEDPLGLLYREQLAFPAMRIEVYNDALDGRIVGVFGRLENRGDRTVSKVQVRLEFRDATGKVQHTEYVHPLLAGGATSDRPLPPGGGHLYALKVPRVPVGLCCERVGWQVTLIEAE
jgi:hypothetical protein